jgi:hypothetical protein
MGKCKVQIQMQAHSTLAAAKAGPYTNKKERAPTRRENVKNPTYRCLLSDILCIE